LIEQAVGPLSGARLTLSPQHATAALDPNRNSGDPALRCVIALLRSEESADTVCGGST
jgi:hypothetical protein